MVKLTCIALISALALPAGGVMAQCRQALALGLDVSGSVDTREYRLQLDGLAAAFQSKEVRETLLSDAGFPVRVAVYEWSGSRNFNRRILVDWTAITDEAALNALTSRLQSTTRRAAGPSTALGAAIEFGTALLAEQTDCPKRTLDISGDGTSNTGPRPQNIVSPNWITINGLTIGENRAGFDPSLQELSAYFEANVIRGPGAFVETSLGFTDYERAMTRKLLRELQGLALSSS
ncbi:DUF1194 domain-containing protein [Shimia gijangensis]|uniref:DUF1194 domain-containing protein n=1 Tax=Shimia gijangensis TaxID=1470563 RepID=UPI001FE54503|nr:DUF1194 domain-containing protein [Shimia gijangensis]